MSTPAPRQPVLGARLAAGWTRAYTRGLPAQPASTRRAEIAADLHDQMAAARAAGIGPGPVSRAIATRMLLGVPADLSWRHHHLRAERPAGRKERAMNGDANGSGTRIAALVALPVLLWSLYVGVGLLAASRTDWTDGQWVPPLILVGALGALVGLLMLAAGNANGAFLVAIAAVVSTIWFLWAPPIPLAGVAFAAGFVGFGLRARRKPPVAAGAQPLST